MDYKIYLAGPISGLSWEEATEWRRYLIDKFTDASKMERHYICFSPLRGKEYLQNENDIKDQYVQHKMSTQKVITRRDFNDIKRSDLMIVNLLNTKKVTIGTMLEIGAAAVLDIPIILIMEEEKNIAPPAAIQPPGEGFVQIVKEMTKNIHDHSMVRESATLICETLDEAFNLSINFLG